MIGALVAIAICGACIGAGAALLAGLRLLREFGGAERIGMAFALGFGVLGWILFFFAWLGWLDRVALGALVAVGLIGLAVLPRTPSREHRSTEPFDGVFWALLIALALVLAADLCEGLSPPVDADSLAYHFALPKQFLSAGRLEFVPRAVDGAVPLLPQMTYLVALGLGGERALTLWTMATGWMPAVLLYGICRTRLSRNWSLAAALLLLTTPAMLYSGGSGQVEPRMALMALATAIAIARALSTRRLTPAVAAGLLAGFVVASKYTGLLFAAAAALPLLFHRRAPAALIGYGVAAALAGLQWYAWNYANSGDPVFPLLFQALHLPDSDIWTQAQDAVFRSLFYQVENPLPRDLFWFLAYPFGATLWPDPTIESGRTGLGPLGLVLLPFALAGAWQARGRLAAQPFAAFAVVTFAYYVLWFVTGSSQRVRHLLIVYPMLVACFLFATTRWSTRSGASHPIAFAIALILVLQIGGQVVYAASYLRHVASGEERTTFLSRNVIGYDVVPWINMNLRSTDKILVIERQLVYLIDVPVFYAHQIDGAVIDVGSNPINQARLWHQMTRQGVTHVALPTVPGDPPQPLENALMGLVDNGCATHVHSADTAHFASRTFATEGRVIIREEVLALNLVACRL